MSSAAHLPIAGRPSDPFLVERRRFEGGSLLKLFAILIPVSIVLLRGSHGP